jgi:hypothetical protein
LLPEEKMSLIKAFKAFLKKERISNYKSSKSFSGGWTNEGNTAQEIAGDGYRAWINRPQHSPCY